MKLIAKIKITGTIEIITGLRIGAGNNDFELGSAQLSVVKSKGVPFIPGSSLKGKLRSLLAKYYGSASVETDQSIIKEIFGDAKGAKDTNQNETAQFRTRLLVRDCKLTKNILDTNPKATQTKEVYTETKWENVIKRMHGGAEHPREVERVPEGTEFEFEMIYDEYDDKKSASHLELLKLAFELLQDDYLGGSGSRGYGKVLIKNISATRREIKEQTYQESEKHEFEL
ncbi:type III-A CRISPR-associated RAMP protein Csm3 [Emticicia sp. 17c]|uniref:type III-A CRISPR-associated RAMP protein Csm3 n=1 Tax=Emticicia sp. 17c TaxID=3127704 RepID=UPI00301DC338